jgi:hypothetical protein
MKWRQDLLLLVAMTLVVGCATVPTGPTVAVMPAPTKPFEVFQSDDALCRQWAGQQIGGASPGETSIQSTAAGAAIGTAAGAGLGAAIGSASGSAGAGAAIGGATGLIAGTAIGSDQGAYSGSRLQRRYDIAYSQCMYSEGNIVPGAPRTYYAPPAPPAR